MAFLQKRCATVKDIGQSPKDFFKIVFELCVGQHAGDRVEETSDAHLDLIIVWDWPMIDVIRSGGCPKSGKMLKR